MLLATKNKTTVVLVYFYSFLRKNMLFIIRGYLIPYELFQFKKQIIL